MSLLKENLTRLATIRDKWIAINDDTVAPSLAKAVRRILPIPFLFEAIPFRQQADDLASLVVQLEEEIVLLERFRQSEFADPYNRSVASAAVPYARAIRNAVAYLRDIKKRMADGLDKVGPQYSWADYNRDLSQYDALRPEVSRTGLGLNSAINGETTTAESTQRPEVPIEEAVSAFLNAVRKHVEGSWQNRASQLPDLLPSADAKLVAFAQGDVSRVLMIHALFAVELRDARRTYPKMLLAQVESLALDTIRANMGDAGEQFAAITMRFMKDFDDAEEGDFDPMLGVGLAMSNFIQVNTSQSLSPDTHLELSKAMFAVATSLKQEWWATFANHMKLEVGA